MNKKTQALEYHVTAKNKIYGSTMPNCKLNFHVKHAKLNYFFGSIVGRSWQRIAKFTLFFYVAQKECYDKLMKNTPL